MALFLSLFFFLETLSLSLSLFLLFISFRSGASGRRASSNPLWNRCYRCWNRSSLMYQFRLSLSLCGYVYTIAYRRSLCNAPLLSLFCRSFLPCLWILSSCIDSSTSAAHRLLYPRRTFSITPLRPHGHNDGRYIPPACRLRHCRLLVRSYLVCRCRLYLPTCIYR